MALANYSDLQASVASWMNRADLTAQIPDFIALAEADIAMDVRVREMLVYLTLSTVPGSEFILLPAGFLEFETVGFDGKPIGYVKPDYLRATAAQYAGRICRYSIEGPNLLIGGPHTGVQSIPVSYYKQLDALSVTPTNFLLTKYPQIYLYGALAKAALFMIDDPRAATWQGVYDAAVGKNDSSNKKALVSGGTLRMRK